MNVRRGYEHDPRFALLADTIAGAHDLETLVRPLLELLEDVTGLESTYLTSVDEPNGLQHVLYARNSQKLQIPEGLDVPWADTLCKRALDEGQMYTDDVAGCWGDSGAARELGIRTYLSTPVRLSDGQLYGTLCAASAVQKPQTEGSDRVLRMFSGLLAQQIERQRLMERLRAANVALSHRALTDALTELPNRRALLDELQARLAAAAASGDCVLAAFIDLDGFKAINDSHGHDAGDRFLAAIGRIVRTTLRADDFAARLGGDEFIVLGSAPPERAAEAMRSMQQRLAQATITHIDLGETGIDYAGASVGVIASLPGERDPDAVLARADAAMYEVKRRRKSSASRP